MNANLYNLFAVVLCYPVPDTFKKCIELEMELKKVEPKFLDLIHSFRVYLESKTQEELEEDYINTFDIQAVCPLEVGYTLFGEDYKRGEFLVRMVELHREHNTALISSELGDYLPNVLMLLARMPDDGFKKDFIEKLIQPALVKMLKNFDDKKGLNPYSLPLRVISDLLSSSYSINSKILEARYE